MRADRNRARHSDNRSPFRLLAALTRPYSHVGASYTTKPPERPGRPVPLLPGRLAVHQDEVDPPLLVIEEGCDILTAGSGSQTLAGVGSQSDLRRDERVDAAVLGLQRPHPAQPRPARPQP